VLESGYIHTHWEHTTKRHGVIHLTRVIISTRTPLLPPQQQNKNIGLNKEHITINTSKDSESVFPRARLNININSRNHSYNVLLFHYHIKHDNGIPEFTVKCKYDTIISYFVLHELSSVHEFTARHSITVI